MNAPHSPGHLSNDLLVRLLDDELTGKEASTVELHLKDCGACRERLAELRHTSNGFDSFLSSLQPAYSARERQQLGCKLDAAEGVERISHAHAAQGGRKWRLAAAAAAVLALVGSLPYLKSTFSSAAIKSAVLPASSAFEVDGETFVALPYSNPDLPVTAPHIVQMQVPVSSLAEAGVYVEPVDRRMAAPDRAVLANVLLGLDGQPLGVHVLTSD